MKVIFHHGQAFYCRGGPVQLHTCKLIKGLLPVPICVKGGGNHDNQHSLKITNDGELEEVNEFCYLGDLLNNKGGSELAVRRREAIAWKKWLLLESLEKTYLLGILKKFLKSGKCQNFGISRDPEMLKKLSSFPGGLKSRKKRKPFGRYGSNHIGLTVKNAHD